MFYYFLKLFVLVERLVQGTPSVTLQGKEMQTCQVFCSQVRYLCEEKQATRSSSNPVLLYESLERDWSLVLNIQIIEKGLKLVLGQIYSTKSVTSGSRIRIFCVGMEAHMETICINTRSN